MDILSVDLGSYSIKFLHIFCERKSVSVKNFSESLLPISDNSKDRYTPPLTLQCGMIKDYLQQNQFVGKLIVNIPSVLTTSRYLSLPTEKLKKAELMIPYQLDENLPFQMSEAHYSPLVYKSGKTVKAIVGITKLTDFDIFYNELISNDLFPGMITTHLFSLHTYLNLPDNSGIFSNIPEKSFLLLDIGHHTTKGYLVKNNQVVANHISGVAGAFINETISEVYQIPLEEAIKYKHANCFFLGESQYNEVDEDQKEFAKLMKKTISPLVRDINQWMLGFRIKNVNPIESVYITGGTSNIKNITGFLSEELKITVKKFQPFQILRRPKSGFPPALELSGANALLQGVTVLSKAMNLNFLKGQYSPTSTQTIPFHSLAFMGIRVLIVCLVLAGALAIENFLLREKDKVLTKNLNSILGNNALNLSEGYKNQLKRNPEALLRTVQKKEKNIVSEVNTLMSAISINALSPLFKVNAMLNPEMKIHIKSFKNNSLEQSVVFQGEILEHLKNLEKRFKNDSTYKKAEIDLVEKDLTLSVKKEMDK